MSLDRQQRLVLLRGDALLARAFLAEGQEITDRAAEFAEGLVVGGFECRRGDRPAGCVGRWRALR